MNRNNNNNLWLWLTCFFIVLLGLLFILTDPARADSDYDPAWQPYYPAMKEQTIAHVADISTTFIALEAVENTAEGSLAGYYFIPAKVLLTYGIVPLLDEESQKDAGHIISDITWGGVANNLILVIVESSAVALSGGIVVAVYLLGCDFGWLE